ncbi:uncharacterized protein LOC132693961 [Panthera onca]
MPGCTAAIAVSAATDAQSSLMKCGETRRVAITKYHRLDGLNNRYCFSHSSGAWKSKIKKEKILLEKTMPSLRMLSTRGQAQQGQGTFRYGAVTQIGSDSSSGPLGDLKAT